ncbi:MAG: hypothetical protein K2M95_00270 [Clostridiales bacterium]|nr:hypothetical protein [Clostridiales bacterium]
MKKKKVKKNGKIENVKGIGAGAFVDPKTDPMGSYTGTVAGAPDSEPVQDADDL